MKKILLGLFLSMNALANDAVVKYGVGIGSSAQDSDTEVVFGSVAFRKPLTRLFIHQLEAGGWYDKRSDMGRYGSAFGSWSFGMHLPLGYWYAEALWGAAFITNPDSYLGGPFQFNHDFAVGVKDARGLSLGIAFKHLSSAGLELPNMGRNFLAIRVGLPL